MRSGTVRAGVVAIPRDYPAPDNPVPDHPGGKATSRCAGTARAGLGLLTLAVLGGLYAFVPPLPPLQVTRPAVLQAALRQRDIGVALALTCLIVTAHFGTYTYVTTFLRESIQPELLSGLLLVYGVAGLVGNLVAGSSAARHLHATFLTCAGLIAAATLLLPVLGRSTAGAVILLVVWGLGYGGVPVCSMSLFAKALPRTREAATVLFTSSFQATLSAGALLGGLVVDAWSVSVAMVSGGLCALLACTVLLGFRRAT
ncbi:MFS transporter [Kribbella sp. NPDC050470]|uniref:MFS transporter n=1 Tax=unclassified Kribbella TaxID=2644121 RepID=UPI00379688CB